MNIEEIKEIVIEKIFVERLEVEREEIEECDSNLSIFAPESLALDSVEALDIVAGLQEEFSIEIDELNSEQITKVFYSIDSICKFVQGKLKENDA